MTYFLRELLHAASPWTYHSPAARCCSDFRQGGGADGSPNAGYRGMGGSGKRIYIVAFVGVGLRQLGIFVTGIDKSPLAVNA